ncbi:DMT family transporter [Pedobacter ginsengiterrae]|uniref:DMT family transporter n=1 Tax=Pedobacter ginsengiterrae TaxID=871696 RepID=A0ABP7PGI6_9SPHI
MKTDKSNPNGNFSGYLNGLIGVLLFSGSLPATRLAVIDFSPGFLTASRGSIAGILALTVLLISRPKLPSGKQISSLIIVSLGVVVGYPLLSALALQHISSAHSIIFVGLLPLSTAAFAVLRGGERPKPLFWFFSVLGSLLVIGYALFQGISGSYIGDLLMLAAIIVCGFGYAEGAEISKTLGGLQVISWALVLAMPAMIAFSWFSFPSTLITVHIGAWISLGYVALFSSLIAFIFWYKGLAQGGTATVGQLQLLQPFFGLALAALLLDEQVNAGMIIVVLGVILCVACSKRYAR